MSFHEFLAILGISNMKTFWGILAFLMSIGIEIIPSIKFNPWSSLIKWIGKNFNDKLNRQIDAKIQILSEDLSKKDKEISQKVDQLNSKVDKLNNDFQTHIDEYGRKSLQDTRRDLLNFCNSCMNHRKHTKEEFDFAIGECDYYEAYIREHDIKNGVIEAAIREIRRLYDKCIQENSFLKVADENE